jgi:hypothetical protein
MLHDGWKLGSEFIITRGSVVTGRDFKYMDSQRNASSGILVSVASMGGVSDWLRVSFRFVILEIFNSRIFSCNEMNVMNPASNFMTYLV